MQKKFSCDSCRKKLSDYQLGFTSERENELIKAHLSVCPECRTELEAYEKLENILHSEEALPLPQNFESNLHIRLNAESEKIKIRKNGLAAIFENIFSKSRVLVPVLSAFILVAVFSTGIYQLMLEQNQEDEMQGEIIQTDPAPTEYTTEAAPAVPEPEQAAAETDNTPKSVINGQANKTTEQAPPLAKGSEENIHSRAEGNSASSAQAENESVDLTESKPEAAQKKASGITETEEACDDSVLESEAHVPYMASYRAFDEGAAAGGAASQSIYGDNIYSAYYGHTIYLVYIEVRNPKALVNNLNLADKGMEWEDNYELYLSEEEYNNLLKELPHSAEILSSECASEGDGEAIYQVNIMKKQ